MARRSREQEEEAFHHVYARGNRRGAVFHDDDDRRWFLERLLRLEKDTGAVHVAHCLMTNHVHLLVRPGRPGISKLLQRLLGPYTQWFNLRHGCVGHVFQGRFGSRTIDSEKDLLDIIRYIHRNPVEAGIVPQPGLWKWSSHRDHLLSNPPEYLREGAHLARSLLAENSRRALVLLRRLVEDPEGRLLVPLPDEDRVDRPPSPSADTRTGSAPTAGSLEGLAARIEEEFSLADGNLRGPGRERALVEARRAFCLAATRVSGFTLTQTAAYLNRSLSNVSVILAAAEREDRTEQVGA